MRKALPWLAALVFLPLYLWASAHLDRLARPQADQGLRVRVPVLLQILQAGGDRYLAANMAVIRSATVGAEVTDDETFRVQAALADDASLLNARHEDNFYYATAILPWQGYLEETQRTLQRAAQARYWDMWPAFFYAFNLSYFENKNSEAAQWAEVAAQRIGEPNASALRVMAAKWYEREADPEQGIVMIERLKTVLKEPNSVRLLDARITRLQGLIQLQKAAERYQLEKKMPLQNLEELIAAGYLSALPKDPLRMGYALDAEGRPQLARVKN